MRPASAERKRAKSLKCNLKCNVAHADLSTVSSGTVSNALRNAAIASSRGATAARHVIALLVIEEPAPAHVRFVRLGLVVVGDPSDPLAPKHHVVVVAQIVERQALFRNRLQDQPALRPTRDRDQRVQQRRDDMIG